MVGGDWKLVSYVTSEKGDIVLSRPSKRASPSFPLAINLYSGLLGVVCRLLTPRAAAT